MNHNHKLRKQLHLLRSVKRKKHHILLHKIHRKHNISKKTLLYVKEYGPHSHITKIIIKESLFVLLLSTLLSAIGGISLEEIKSLFVAIVPLVIMLPVLNDMIGDYGTIISSRFSTMLHENKVKGNIFKNKELRKLFFQVFSVALIMALLSAFASLIIARFSNFDGGISMLLKVVLITLIDVSILVSVLFAVAIIQGIRIFKKQEDPDNFLVPITTSIADFGNMFVLTILILILF